MLKEESLNDRIGRLDYILLIKSFCQKLIAFLAKPPAPPPHTHIQSFLWNAYLRDKCGLLDLKN